MLAGHGQSTRSPGGHYSAKALADDVESFLLERDLYVRPVAVVGVGLGADVAVTLGARNPRLVGALALIDYSPEALQQLVFFPLQAATFSGTLVGERGEGERWVEEVGAVCGRKGGDIHREGSSADLEVKDCKQEGTGM
jgi:pimeloyl-ACP methyl ester carboxylesterase